MKKFRFLAVCAASLLILGLTALATPTQEADDAAAAAPTTGQRIGLLDVGYIFKNYPRFTESRVEMRADVQATEAELTEKRESLTGMQKQLRLLVVGTREYAKLEQRITMSQAELAGSIQTRKVKFARREARLYHNAYQEIGQVVEDYARDNNLSVVLRFSDDPVNANDPKGIQQEINRTVVWHDGGRDLTRIILQRLIKKSKQSEESKEAAPEDLKEPIPEAPAKPKKEDPNGDGQRTSHLG